MVLEALAEWNHWWREKTVEKDLLGKERAMLKELKSSLKFREIKLLIGIRRSGKSTLFYQLINYLLNKNVKPEEILLVNFEDEIFAKKSLREIFDVYQSSVSSNKRPYLFLDEVHRCEEWALFLRKLYDLKRVGQIFIADSSSKFIKPEYSRVLTGRNIKIAIFPLSFPEFLSWRGIKPDALRFLGREQVNRIKKELSEYLKWGGFPEVFFMEPAAKKKLLTEYFGDILYKDIVARYKVNYDKIRPLADFLISNLTSPFSPRKYSRSYGLSLESISTYLQYLQEVFLFYFVPKFSYSIKTQQLSPKKVYVNDSGFFTSIAFKFTENVGKLYENAVFIELVRRGKEVYYWKNKNECDFLVKRGLKIREAIQVCYNLSSRKQQEVLGLVEVLDNFNLKSGLIITKDYEGEEKFNGKSIKFIPLWKWLLTRH